MSILFSKAQCYSSAVRNTPDSSQLSVLNTNTLIPNNRELAPTNSIVIGCLYDDFSLVLLLLPDITWNVLVYTLEEYGALTIGFITFP